MKKLIKVSLLILALFLVAPVNLTYAELANGASVDPNDVPFLGSSESLVLIRNQNQYFYDPTKNSLSTPADFTLEAWIKLTQFYPGGTWIVTKDDGATNRQFSLAAADIQKIAFQVRGVGNLNSSNANLPLNTWTHVAAVWHSSTKSVDFYINGQYDSSSSTSQSIPTSGDNAELQVGRQQAGLYGNYDGKIAEVRVWGVARNSFQIANDYNHTLTGNEYGLLAYYPKWTSNDLNVPLLKQTSEPWQDQIYDSANLWNPSNPTINRWGCALTSAVMVLKYYGINKLPDGTNLDPGSLNTWLNTNKGYVNGGLVSWAAISRLSKQAKQINNITTFDTLEYFPSAGGDTAQLTTDLNNNIPVILRVPGHFIVAKGVTQDSFSINDPFYNYTDLNSYGNTFLSMGKFVPSFSDLSYIVIAVNTNIEANLKNSVGDDVGVSFIESIEDPTEENQQNIEKKMIYFSKPQTDAYVLELSSDTSSPYNAEIHMYDEEGNPVVVTRNGSLEANNITEITINFDKSDVNNSEVQKEVDFDTVIDDINTLRSIKEIKNEGLKIELVVIMKTAKAIVNTRFIKRETIREKLTELVFNRFEKVINKNRGKHLTEAGYQVLLHDISALRTTYLP